MAVSTVAAAWWAKWVWTEPIERLGPEQRHVPRQDDYRPRVALERRLRLQQGVSSAQLWLLNGKRHRLPVTQTRLDQLSLVPHDNHDGFGRQRVSCPEDALDERQAAGGMEDLGYRGLHPRALPCREEDDVKTGHQGTGPV